MRNKIRLKKLEEKSAKKHKRFILAHEGIINFPEDMKGLNIYKLNLDEDKYIVWDIVEV